MTLPTRLWGRERLPSRRHGSWEVFLVEDLKSEVWDLRHLPTGLIVSGHGNDRSREATHIRLCGPCCGASFYMVDPALLCSVCQETTAYPRGLAWFLPLADPASATHPWWTPLCDPLLATIYSSELFEVAEEANRLSAAVNCEQKDR